MGLILSRRFDTYRILEMKLKQTKQCATCPWKVSATVADIPGYNFDRHRGLITTIADETGNLSGINQPIRIMACHNSSKDNEYECIGWLYNQLESGNHIPLRIEMKFCSNAKEIEIDGEHFGGVYPERSRRAQWSQVDTFDETFK